ncbi:MAG TPA: TRAP transporter large permease subunit [Bacteriovoracaceae bacterium]|nr:TRAP transporter large permease subunit [Bacteriovoracaceae bacterium]
MSIGLIILSAILVSLAFGLPLFVIMGSLTAICYLLISGETMPVIVGDIFYAADKEILLAIPLFVLAGQIMTKGSISQRLIDIARTATAGIPGGMGIAAILSCGVFAAISGSSPVTLIAIGSLMYPALVAAGYPKKLAMGAVTVGGTLGIIVPPSIPMIIFAIMAGVSVVDLFKAGIGPSIVLVLLLCGYMLYASPKNEEQKFSLSDFTTAFKRGFLSIFMPVIILGGIYGGFVTATESAAIAVVYALIVELLIHREIKMKDFAMVWAETAEMLGMLFLILVLAVSLNKFMTFEQIPESMVETMSGFIHSKLGFLLCVNILLLIVGCFMDAMSAILVLAPLLTPMAIHYGVNPIHFGIIMVVNLEIGYLTPPIGINLFVASGMFKVGFTEVVKAIVPFLFVMLLGLAIICAIPEISLFMIK